MFRKFTDGNKPGSMMKNYPATDSSKEKDMWDKISRIQESYVDAAIRSVRKKMNARNRFGIED